MFVAVERAITETPELRIQLTQVTNTLPPALPNTENLTPL